MLSTGPLPAGSAVSAVCIAVIYSFTLNIPDVICNPMTAGLVIWFIASVWDRISPSHVDRSDHSRCLDLLNLVLCTICLLSIPTY